MQMREEVGQPYKVVNKLKCIYFAQTYRIISGEELQHFGLCSAPLINLWARRDLYRATPVMTRDLGFYGIIIRTDSISSPFYDKQGVY